jgi:HSP20 family protein
MTQIEIQQTTPPREILETPCTTARGLDTRFAGGIDGSFAPTFEIQEHELHFLLKADVPGVAPEDLSIFVENDWITVCGRRLEEPACANYRAYERTFGSFWRAFRVLPSVTATGSWAQLERGVLTVFIPKRGAPS